ncbi:hypothetical protein EJ04DRAFT_541159 [Polyplosphaeria fusca]|uniref:TAFII28-like protein domain-containing protein n=1 Tax=Polyplosphaeria fusca TaxID=682080 RepID=A0A9P4V6Q8_9PLEO|nr:hypothetical protein EJ04DRAFT_541159 [Polyplosphaeria fusca]
MASPPPSIPTINIPRKRSSISSVTSTAKKRKPSGLRNAYSPEATEIGASPLRYSRSPSVDSVATTSVVNGTGGRKRRKKDGDTTSQAGTSVRGGQGRDGRSATGAVEDGVEGDVEDGDGEADDDEDGDELLGEKETEMSKKQEKEAERMLFEAMNTSQQARYDFYRRVRLKREIVRRLVNQTLSQSVPAPVIIAVTSYSKAFMGDLIDRALTVRDEWTAAATHRPNPNMPLPMLQQALSAPKGYIKSAKPNMRDLQTYGGYYNNGMKEGDGYWVEVPKDAPLQDRLKQEDKGPLTPAHIREALRRYKRDREGGGAGFAGLSLEGVERTASRMGGKRLFR